MEIIHWSWKHGDLFFDASTPEKKEASALRILHMLIEEMQYMYEPEESHFKPYNVDDELASLTDEQVAALPTQGMREQANKERDKVERARREYASAKAEWENVQRVLAGEEVLLPQQYYRADDKDGRWKKGDPAPRRRLTAWSIIQGRNGYEYENFSLEDVWTAPEENDDA